MERNEFVANRWLDLRGRVQMYTSEQRAEAIARLRAFGFQFLDHIIDECVGYDPRNHVGTRA